MAQVLLTILFTYPFTCKTRIGLRRA